MAYEGKGFDASRRNACDVRDGVTDQPNGGSEAESGANVGWFRDPTKHHEFRFRDEQGWTRQVSHFGVVGDDPYWAPAAWYRDPSRRFRYRYWDDEGWTAQSSLGGSTTHDPVDAVWPPPSPFGARDDVDGLKERATAWSRSQSSHRTAAPNIKPALGVVPAYVGHALRMPLEGGVWPYAPWGRRVV